MKDDMFNINNFVGDGFVKVCDVEQDQLGHWCYKNINKPVMFDNHKSWVYFIVVKNEIVKVGETGNPLGIKPQGYWCMPAPEEQPKKGTTNRLGRYRAGDGTDHHIRCALREEVDKGIVSIWARKCKMVVTETVIAGEKQKTMTSFHKDLELQYLRYFVEKTGRLPRLNKSHK